MKFAVHPIGYPIMQLKLLLQVIYNYKYKLSTLHKEWFDKGINTLKQKLSAYYHKKTTCSKIYDFLFVY